MLDRHDLTDEERARLGGAAGFLSTGRFGEHVRDVLDRLDGYAD